jgi:hypothetical protein
MCIAKGRMSMEFERVTTSMEKKSIDKVKVFKDIFREIKNSNYDKITFSFSNLQSKNCILITENFEWLDKYVNDKLYLEDPICDWEDLALCNLKRLTNKTTEFIDIDKAHENINGKKLREIRSQFNIKSGGISVSYFDNIVLSVGWWSSNINLNFMENYGSSESRIFFEKLIKEILFIYCQNKGMIFKNNN